VQHRANNIICSIYSANSIGGTLLISLHLLFQKLAYKFSELTVNGNKVKPRWSPTKSTK
jgi:hypothetical protein